jgi:hypothetical protein
MKELTQWVKLPITSVAYNNAWIEEEDNGQLVICSGDGWITQHYIDMMKRDGYNLNGMYCHNDVLYMIMDDVLKEYQE